jgi:NAD(P)-dependent dehydrogenase (short-subunit alcohol dehydrogenase family)
MKTIRGAHALVTGGSRGLGPHIAHALAGEGANLTLTARSAAALGEVVEGLAGKATRVHSIAADVCDADARRKLLEEAEAELGPIDILVNNAGIEQIVSFTDLPPDRIEAMIATNLVAPLILSRLVLEKMISRGRGHVVMMSSLGGKKGSPYSATYAATKAGLIAWTSGLRTELQGKGGQRVRDLPRLRLGGRDVRGAKPGGSAGARHVDTGGRGAGGRARHPSGCRRDHRQPRARAARARVRAAEPGTFALGARKGRRLRILPQAGGRGESEPEERLVIPKVRA